MKRLRVLIVDDSSVMRKIIARSLRQAGLELEDPIEAGDGWEALVCLQQPVDLILCDINMPAMSGFEFIRMAKSVSNGRAIPIVMITTEGSDMCASEAMACGAQGYVRKPFTPAQLREQVFAVLQEVPTCSN